MARFCSRGIHDTPDEIALHLKTFTFYIKFVCLNLSFLPLKLEPLALTFKLGENFPISQKRLNSLEVDEIKNIILCL